MANLIIYLLLRKTIIMYKVGKLKLISKTNCYWE